MELSFIQCIYYEYFTSYKMFYNTVLNILNLHIFIKKQEYFGNILHKLKVTNLIAVPLFIMINSVLNPGLNKFRGVFEGVLGAIPSSHSPYIFSGLV